MKHKSIKFSGFIIIFFLILLIGCLFSDHASYFRIQENPEKNATPEIKSRNITIWGTNGTTICTASDGQYYPEICSDGTGGAIIVWEDYRNIQYDIYAQRVNSSGVVQWTTDGIAICTVDNDQSQPKICSDGSGGAIITWQDNRNGYDSDIYTQRINSAGVIQWATNGINICTANDNQILPEICSDGFGGAIITWQDMRNSSNSDIFVQKINSAGIIQWTPDGVVICKADNNQNEPQICNDASGGALISWFDYRSGSDYDIYAQRINSTGLVQWPIDGVGICTANSDQTCPEICNDGVDGHIITWYDSRNGNFDIYTQRIDSAGVVQWALNGVAICLASDDQTAPEICSDGFGGAVITWQDRRNVSLSSSDIYAQNINSTGIIQWIADGIAICTANGGQEHPEICSSDSDIFVITWFDHRSSDEGIYAQNINSTGVAQWIINGIEICTYSPEYPIGGKYHRYLISDLMGNAIITWQDHRNSNVDIYAQCIKYSNISATIPSSPQILQVTAGNGQSILTWQAPSSNGGSPITNYKIYRGTSSGSETYLLTVGNSLNYTNTGLPNGQTYYYKVSAVNGVGEGPLSNEANITFVTVPYTTWGGAEYDWGSGVALDSSGYIYCVGGTSSFGPGNLALVKFYPDGAQAWNTTWGGANDDWGSDVALDSSGNIYCVGVTSSFGAGGWDFAVVKFYPNSTRAWNTTWGGADDDWGNGVALDSSGNIYCVGSTSSFGPDNLALVKFYPNGTQAWNTTWNVGSSSNINDVALDSNGNIYCVGNFFRMSELTVYLALFKFYPDGAQAWNTTWGVAGGGESVGYGVALDSGGNIYCVGGTSSQISTVIPYNLFLVKFYPDGAQAWNTTWGGANDDWGSDVALDSSGNIYCVGGTYSFGAGGWDFAVVKFYPNSTRAWNTTWGGADDDWGSGVALDSSRNIYCVGWTLSFGAGGEDLVLVKFVTPSAPQNLQATAGNRQVTLTWQVPSSNGGSGITNYKIYRGTSPGSESYLITVGAVLTYNDTGLINGQTYYYKVSAVNGVGEGPVSNEVNITFVTVPHTTWGGADYDSGSGVALDSSGNIYCVGGTSSFGIGLGDLALVKFYLNGAQAWNITWGGADFDWGSGVALDSSGNIYCVGSTYSFGIGLGDLALVKFYPNGTRAWNTTWGGAKGDGGSDVALDSSGNIYCVGSTSSFGVGDNLALVKFYPNGALAWNTTWGGAHCSGSGVALDSTGNIYCVGTKFSMAAATVYLVLVKFSPNGTRAWYTTWGVACGCNGGSGVALDSSGNIYCVGETGGDINYGPFNLALVKFYPNGAQAWNITWDSAGDDWGSDMALDSSGNIYCVGRTGSGDLVLVKFYPNGAQAWNITWGGADYDWGSDVALDSSGNIYCVGGTYSFGKGSGDLALIKFATPSTIQNFQATAGNGQITLTWQAPSSNGGSAITNYKIYRGTLSGNETYLTSVGNILNYTDTGLINGQLYYYQVSAINGVGEGPLANEVNATAATGPITLTSVLPNPSNGLTTITATNASKNVNANGILANVSTPSGGWLYPVMTYVESNQWIGTFTVASDGDYTVRINATETSGGTTYAGPMSITGDITLPSLAIITLPTVNASMRGTIWINATATDPDGIKNITFYRDSATLIGTDTAAPYAIQWTTVGLDGAHTLHVRAFDYAGNYLDSAGVNITVDNTVPTAASISFPSTGAYLKSSITITAIATDAGSGVKNVTFYRDAGMLIGTDMAAPYAINWNTTIVANGNHTLYVRAFDNAGNYRDSLNILIIVNNTALIITIPTAPQNLQATLGNGFINLIWQVPSNSGGLPIVNYKIYRGTSPGNETYLVTINNISSFTDTNAIKGQPYYYRVSAVNAMGESPWSAEVIAIIHVSEKGDQTLNVIIIILLGAVLLGISGYLIYYGRKIKILNDRIAKKSIEPLGKKGAKPRNWLAVDSFEIEDQIEHLPVSAEEKEVMLTELHGLENNDRIEVYNNVSGNLPENKAEILWNSLMQRFERLYKVEKWSQALLLLEQLFEIADFLGDQNKVTELSLKYEEIQEKLQNL